LLLKHNSAERILPALLRVLVGNCISDFVHIVSEFCSFVTEHLGVISIQDATDQASFVVQLVNDHLVH